MRDARSGSRAPIAHKRRRRVCARVVRDLSVYLRVTNFVENTYPAMEKAWSALDRTWRDSPVGGTYKIFLSDVCERWPMLLDLLDGETTKILEAYFGSHFRYSYVEPYRTMPPKAVFQSPRSGIAMPFHQAFSR